MKENKNLEFKSDITNSFLKTVSAFANYEGGKILFGVNDNGDNIGVADPKSFCLKVENKINDNIKPSPDYKLEINDRTKVITLSVEKGNYKPYFYNSKAYKRNDTATIEVDGFELKRLILEGENLSYEELRSFDQELTFTVLEKMLRDQLGLTSFSNDILASLGLYDKENGYNKAAELLADSNNYPGIDAIRFGSSISIIMDRMTFDNRSILEQYEGAVNLFCKYYQYEEIIGSKREKKELIPEKAFREAIANALVHRTWDVPANINILMFENSIEITSPGGLPQGITIDEYLAGGLSIPRNPIICSVFLRLKLIERFGTGIRRINEAYSDSESKPKYLVSDSMIKIILPLHESHIEISDNERLVLDILKKYGKMSMTSTEVAEYAKAGKTKVVAILNKLVESGQVIKNGNGRGTTYTMAK